MFGDSGFSPLQRVHSLRALTLASAELMIFQGVKLCRIINKPMWGEVGMVEFYLVRDILELIYKNKNLHLCPVISFQ